jgi:hypothetical protein
MAKDFNKEVTMDIQKDFDFIIEEGGNSSLNLRKISWNGRDPKLDLRKWSYQDGQERAMKGVTMSDDGANELAGVLVEQGYGNTKRIIKAVREREEYSDVIKHFNDTEEDIDDGSEEYYDPSELLGSSYEEED